MPHINIEIKARSAGHNAARQWLQAHGAEFRGLDHQVDTYFNVPGGRLKLRQGNIENNLIFYHRSDEAGPKQSDVTLYKPADSGKLKQLLTDALGVKTVVNKQREIYFIGNVKFHLDTVAGLGTFVEIESIDADGTIGTEKLRQQCEYYMQQFEIQPSDLLERSYSDMLMDIT